jgi:hypothetical protein
MTYTNHRILREACKGYSPHWIFVHWDHPGPSLDYISAICSQHIDRITALRRLIESPDAGRVAAAPVGAGTTTGAAITSTD